MSDQPAAVMADGTSANEEFKRSSSIWFWGSISAATVVHFLVFALWPSMSAEDVSISVEDIPIIELPPEVEIPPPPEAIRQPAKPVISDMPIEEDVTIEEVIFTDSPENLPPPPDVTDSGPSDAPIWTPRDVEPEFRDERAREAMRTCLERHYPPLLRDAGIGGKVVVWAYVDETGKVVKTQLNQSSGHAAMDDVAVREVRVCPGAEFSPGVYGDKPVPLWVALPITFTPR